VSQCRAVFSRLILLYFPNSLEVFNLSAVQKCLLEYSDTTLQYLYTKIGVFPHTHFHKMAFSRSGTEFVMNVTENQDTGRVLKQ